MAAAARALKQADLELKAEGNALFLEALGRYLEAWLAELDLALAEKRVALNEAQLAAAKAQEAQGQATFKDVLEAESALAEAKASLFAAQNARALASARLERILGRAVAPKALPFPRTPRAWKRLWPPWRTALTSPWPGSGWRRPRRPWPRPPGTGPFPREAFP